MDGATRARLELIFDSGEDFLRASRRDAGGTPLRFRWRPADGRDLPPEASLGDLVSATIAIVDREADFHVHLRVTERLAEGDLRGLVFEFLPEERSRQELVLACAEGESIPYLRRRRPRVSCSLPVVLVPVDRQELHGTCNVISVGGMHVGIAGALGSLKPDALVQVQVEIADRRLRVPGRVTSRIDDGPQRGVGIEFLFESARQRDEIAEQVGALEAAASRHRTDR